MPIFLICSIFKVLLPKKWKFRFRYCFIVSLFCISFLFIEFKVKKIWFRNVFERIIFLYLVFLDIYLIWRRQVSLLNLFSDILSNTLFIPEFAANSRWNFVSRHIPRLWQLSLDWFETIEEKFPCLFKYLLRIDSRCSNTITYQIKAGRVLF